MNKTQFSIANLNIQCMSTKINELHFILEENNIDILCITEHWFSEESIQTLSLQNYKIASAFSRKTYKHGGVLILTKKQLNSKALDFSNYNEEKSFEVCGISIPQLNTVVLTMYRSPEGNEESFLYKFNQVANEIRNQFKKRNIFFAGDYNVDIQEKTAFSNEMAMLLSENGLRPIFDLPSRIGGKRCIDNIFVDKYFRCQNTVRNWHMGDHLCQIISFQRQAAETKKPELIKIRQINTKTTQEFKKLIKNYDWSIIYRTETCTGLLYEIS